MELLSLNYMAERTPLEGRTPLEKIPGCEAEDGVCSWPQPARGVSWLSRSLLHVPHL